MSSMINSLPIARNLRPHFHKSVELFSILMVNPYQMFGFPHTR